jgi:hypothetical protein
MASSIHFNPSVKALLPAEVLERFRIIPVAMKKDKLCLIAHRPLTDQQLSELKALTGIQDYELQLVGDDVLTNYISKYADGSLFTIMG